MKRALLIILLLAQVPAALPQEAPPIQLAAAASEEAEVTLPDPGASTKLMWIGLGALAVLVLLAGVTVSSQCFDSDECGPGIGPIGTGPTGTR